MRPNNVNWFTSAGDTAELFHISRFVSEGIFATDEGGYGAVLQLTGLDPECMSSIKMKDCGASMLRAQRLISERISLFQTFIKRRASAVQPSRFATDSPDDVVRHTETARNEFVASRPFFEVTIHWTLYIHPPSKKVSEFGPESQKMLRELRTCLVNLRGELAEFGVRGLDSVAIFRFFGYLAQLEEPRIGLRSPHQVGHQFSDRTVTWRDYHLAFDQGTTRQRVAQAFSLSKRPGFTFPGMFASLLSVPAEFIIVLESRRKTIEDVRAAVSAQEKFIEMFKHNPIVLLVHRKKASPPKTAGSAAADDAMEIGGLGGIVKDVTQRGLTYNTFSLLGLAHAPSELELQVSMSALHRVFGASEATVLEESYGALSCYQALFPGAVSSGVVKSLNVRRGWIREDHLANLSLWFAPECGSQRSVTLEDECLSVLETRGGAPYYFDQFGSGPRGVLVTGEPRRGKTFFVNFTVDHEMKYGGYVFIYDVGGSYEHVARKHGGTIVKVGLDGPRLNLFSLANTEQSHNQTAQLVMLLLERSGAKLRPQDETSIRESVAAIYALENPRLRRLRYLVLAPELQPYLSKWIKGGVYANVFDNEQDDLRLAKIVSFDFEGLNGSDQRVLMEPLLFWIRLRINELIRAKGNIALPKLEVYDEVWRLIQDEGVLASIFETMKTAGKKLGGIILATQDTADLGPHAHVIRNACPDAVFLGGAFDRDAYRSLFAMNDTQLDLIATLRRGEMLLLRRHHSKVVQLNVDEQSKWLYSTHPQDVRRRAAAIEQHGHEKAFELLAVAGNSK